MNKVELNKIVNVLGLSKKSKSDEIEKVIKKINIKYDLKVSNNEDIKTKTENSSPPTPFNICEYCGKFHKGEGSFCSKECETKYDPNKLPIWTIVLILSGLTIMVIILLKK